MEVEPVFLLLAAVVAVSTLYPRFLGGRLSLLMMLPVIAYTVIYLIDWSQLTLATQLRYMGIGLLVGVLVFVIGLPLCSDQPIDYLVDSFRGLSRLVKEPVLDLVYQIGSITYEELIWRVFLVTILSGIMPVWAVVLCAAALFWFVHVENRPIGGHSLEFFLFSAVLCCLFAYTDSMILVWVMHFARNLLIMSENTLSREAVDQEESTADAP